MMPLVPGSFPPGSSSLGFTLPGGASPAVGGSTAQQNSQLDAYVAAASAAQQYAQYYQVRAVTMPAGNISLIF